jgi:hypothetical protein
VFWLEVRGDDGHVVLFFVATHIRLHLHSKLLKFWLFL